MAEPEATPPEPVVTVDIYGQLYHLRGSEPQYLERLADMVDAKMRAVAGHGTTVETLRIAVLAALNLADEVHRARQRYDQLAGSLEESTTVVRSRTGSLSGLLDSVLDYDDRRVG
jgi:cell division protein ZapA